MEDKTPQDKGEPVRKAKVENLAGKEIFTGERDERLDPLRGKITILLTGLMALALLLHTGLTFLVSWHTGRRQEHSSRVQHLDTGYRGARQLCGYLVLHAPTVIQYLAPKHSTFLKRYGEKWNPII